MIEEEERRVIEDEEEDELHAVPQPLWFKYSLPPIPAMLYVFAFGDDWIKVGFTARCPFQRRRHGFWHNVHPTELCGRLGDCELLHLFECDEVPPPPASLPSLPSCMFFVV